MVFPGRATGAGLLAVLLMASPATGAELDWRPALLPAAIQGVWAYEPGDCDQAESDGHLVIGGRTVDFFASAYEITRVVHRAGGRLFASGLRSDEGEGGRTPADLTLRLKGPDRLHVVTESPGGHVYYRCKGGPR